MFPYLIARAIGFVVAKLFEKDEAPKYADGGYIKNIKKLYEEDGSDVYGGDFGEAYSIGDDRVLKKTSSKNEFNLAKQMEGKEIPVLDAFAKIYKTDIINGQMLIILEELEEDSHIEDLYYELQNYLDEQGLPIQYIDHLDTDEIEMSDELQSFMNDLDDIIRAYRYLGIEASDIRPENMGYSKEGKLKAFDIDDKQR